MDAAYYQQLSIEQAEQNKKNGYTPFWCQPENTDAGRMYEAMINGI